MQGKEGFLSGLLTILSAGLFSIFIVTFFALLGSKVLDFYLRNFGRKVAKDVEKDSLESWTTKDS